MRTALSVSKGKDDSIDGIKASEVQKRKDDVLDDVHGEEAEGQLSEQYATSKSWQQVSEFMQGRHQVNATEHEGCK